MASMRAVDSVPSQAQPAASNSDASHEPSTLHAPMPVTTSASEVSNPDHPHHRHHRNIQDFELTDTLGEGSYSTVHIVQIVHVHP
jgi:hypothetical protein